LYRYLIEIKKEITTHHYTSVPLTAASASQHVGYTVTGCRLSSTAISFTCCIILSM